MNTFDLVHKDKNKFLYKYNGNANTLASGAYTRIDRICKKNGYQLTTEFVMVSMTNGHNVYLVSNSPLDLKLDLCDVVGIVTTKIMKPDNLKKELEFKHLKEEKQDQTKNLKLPVEAPPLGDKFNIIEIDCLIVIPGMGYGTFVLEAFKKQHDIIFLKSIITATPFYARCDFSPVFYEKQDGNDENWFKLPYWFTEQQPIQPIYDHDQDKKTREDTCVEPEGLDYFEHGLIPMLWCVGNIFRPLANQVTGGSMTINYKGYRYKLRTDRYGKYIITKYEGRVSYTKVIKFNNRVQKASLR